MAKIWFQVYTKEKHPPVKSDIWKALNKEGLEPYELEEETTGEPGIILFDAVTPVLFSRVHDLSRNGLVRILAVGLLQKGLSARDAWALLRAGASDVITWRRGNDLAGMIIARLERWAAVDQLLEIPLIRDYMVGRSPPWISVLRRVVEVARFTNASVLITGETGTGKELVARLIHALDPRPHKNELTVLDCTTIMPSLSGSEFFGHERGAFTGAHAPRDGAFALADGGTLFLDEIAELPLDLQAQLLRVVQEGTYKRVGGNSWQDTKFRLVCATNRDFSEELAQGRFRRDFFYRIASWTCRLPPLRERPDDILLLARHFMHEALPDRDPPELDELVKAYLVKRDYPGNIRDLRHLVLRMLYHHVGDGPITIGDIPTDERLNSGEDFADWRNTCFENAIQQALLQGHGLKEIGRAAEEVAIRRALDNEDGNLKRAAGRLSVTERALQIRRAARRKKGGV